VLAAPIADSGPPGAPSDAACGPIVGIHRRKEGQPSVDVEQLSREVGELIQSYLMLIGKARAKGKTSVDLQAGFHKEVADVFCHILLLASFHVVGQLSRR